MGFFGFSSKSAKGNVFTNGIVNRAVAFPMGLMGEAGPEAIMPLQRAPTARWASAPPSPGCPRTAAPAPARAAWP